MNKRKVMTFLAIIGCLSIPVKMLNTSCKELQNILTPDAPSEGSESVYSYRYPIEGVTASAGIIKELFDMFDNIDVDAAEFIRVKQLFMSFVSDFDTWCESSEQLDMTAVHSVTSDGQLEILSDSRIQTSNETRVSHLKANKQHYSAEMWYNIKEEAYYVKMMANETETPFIYLSNDVPSDMKQFFYALGGYSTTYNTLQTVLTELYDKITVNENTLAYKLSGGPKDNQWCMEYTNSELDIDALSTTFDTEQNPLQSFKVSVQYIADTLYVDIDYLYDENSVVSEESYNYVLGATDTYMLEPPPYVLETEESVNTLIDIYNKIMKGV